MSAVGWVRMHCTTSADEGRRRGGGGCIDSNDNDDGRGERSNDTRCSELGPEEQACNLGEEHDGFIYHQINVVSIKEKIKRVNSCEHSMLG